MTNEVKALIAEARRVVGAPTLKPKVPNLVLIERLADALEAATVAPAVDREALARELYAADFWGDENAHRDWDELIAHPVHFERYRARADVLLASGLLRDVRDVQAEALEAEEFAFTDAEWTTYQRMPEQGVSHRGHLEHVVNSRLRSRARAIREARSERD